MRAYLATIAVLALVNGACAKSPGHQASDVCEVIHQAPALLGKEIRVTGWYGSIGLAGSAIGSGECPDALIEPHFASDVSVRLIVTDREGSSQLREALSAGTPAPSFYGRFHGTLSRRTGHVQSGPVPLDAEPSLGDMPHVFAIKHVDVMRFERATFLEEAPPEPVR